TLGLASFAYAQVQPPQGHDYPFGSDMMNGYDGHDYGMMDNGYRADYDYPQDQTSPPSEYPYGPDMMDGYGGYGFGMMGDGYGMMGSGMMGWNGDEGPMHEVMIDSLAQSLNLSPEEIEARHDAGESIWEIAEAEGLSEAEIRELMVSAHDTVLENAVSEGWLTQEQAVWMDEHMNQMWDGDYNHCGGGIWNEAGVGWHGMGW
ncbi:MAG: hypothetical protein GWN30_18255, partial [Gammaproteobacteria bacterium]|nr:hypothetical protein [Gammaproteobacteria bacterium]